MSNEMIKTIPRDKTESLIGQSPFVLPPNRRFPFELTSAASNESEALNASTNRNGGAEGSTCHQPPTAMRLTMTHHPSAVFVLPCGY